MSSNVYMSSSQHKVGAYSIFMSQADCDSRAKERYEASVRLLQMCEKGKQVLPKWLVDENKRLVDEYEERKAMNLRHKKEAEQHMRSHPLNNTNYTGQHEGRRDQSK